MQVDRVFFVLQKYWGRGAMTWPNTARITYSVRRSSSLDISFADDHLSSMALGSTVINWLFLALVVCAVLGQAISSANAAPCAHAIAKVQMEARASLANPDTGPTAPQSIAAQLGHEPMPESLEQGQEEAHSRFIAALNRAKTLNAEGRRAKCLQAITYAKRLLETN